MANFALRGTMQAVYKAGAIAVDTAPTQAELTTAVTDLIVGAGSVGERMADLADWNITTSTIPAPGADTFDTPTITGETDLGEPSMTFYIDPAVHPIDTALAEDVTGKIVLMPEGIGSGKLSLVCACTVQTNQVDWQVDNAPATYTVTFARTSAVEGVQAA